MARIDKAELSSSSAHTKLMPLRYKNILEIFEVHKAELHEKFHVKSLAIFGSVCRGTATTSSDVDILVQYKQTPGFFAFLDLKQYLEDIVGRPVDLVTEGALKKQLRDKIIKEANTCRLEIGNFE